MICWAVEYRHRSGWSIDERTIRRLRRDALQAGLDVNPADGWWEEYHRLRREGKARAVKLRLARCPR